MYGVIIFEMEHQMGTYSAKIYFQAIRERHLFDQQLTALLDDDILNAFVFVVDEATNKIAWFAAADPFKSFVTFSRNTETKHRFACEIGNGTVTVMNAEPRALVAMISRSVLAQPLAACMLLLKWTLIIGTVYHGRGFGRREKMSNEVLVLQINVALTIL